MIGFIRFLLHTRKLIALAGLIVVAAFIAAALCAPALYGWNSVTMVHLATALRPPSAAFPLGADEMGRDLLGRIIWGARISLLVAGAAVATGLAAGLFIGLLTGFYPGRLSDLTMRVMDALISFPRILVAIMLIAILGPGMVSLMLAISVSGIPVFARLFRASTLTLKEREFVAAARALGARDIRLMARHILPNMVSVIIVQSSLSLAEAILIASGLSFLGLGPQPPIPEWGAMIADARAHIVSTPHVVYGPGIALLLVVLALNVVGDGLRDYLDPRGRHMSNI